MPTTNVPNEYNHKKMIVNATVHSANTNDDIDVDKNLINQQRMISSSWENNNSLYQINNGSDNYLQGGTLLQHQAAYLPLQPQGYYNYGNYHPSLLTPLDPFGSLLNQYGGGYNPLANSTRALGLRPPPEGYTAPANSTQRYSVTSSSSATSGQDNNKRPPTKKSKTTKTKIITDKKSKRNAQSRKRGGIDSIKAAPNEEKTTDEKLLVKEVQLKREKKNKQTAERAKEKKAEIERINMIPQNKRTAEEAKSLATATSTKKRKNECTKLRGEKKSGLKKKKKTSNSNDAGGKAKNGKSKKDAEYYSSTSLHQSPGTFMQTMSAGAPRWHDLLKVCERSVTEEEEEEQKTVGQMEGV